ncbi:hypothetical protein CR205_16035 [Alteribacter lacisalsi]|uniref:N-acetylmuramoyl-L-alanine amidase n=1 Tax=Alteribacter lacisalsi TaxID=2045244 RepID=A0A2W0H3Y7_9BACI|nr:N-acetylmuramoyl-L-alanine amidase [Alteribacter lacisalsi]PYZ95887.1 hypothetical protein CR205_16035 [Alteribacter lacisalsi]
MKVHTNIKAFLVFTVTLLFSFTLYTEPADAADLEFDRISGDNRIGTAIQISQKGWPNGLSNGDNTVIIARSDHPADALASASLAGKMNAPILLTSQNSLHADLTDELNRLNASKAYILGGTDAISSNVSQSLQNLGLSVERVEGSNRYETAKAINEAANLSTSSHALLVNGQTIADALSASGIAAVNEMPIYLTGSESLAITLPSEVETVTMIGGETVLSEGIENELNALGIETNRIAGDNRYETNIQAIQSFDFASDESIMVRGTTVSSQGEDYPDAVAAGGLAGQLGSPVVLTHPEQARTDVRNFLLSQSGLTYVLGGTTAISETVLQHLNQDFDENAVTDAYVNAKSGLNIRSTPGGSVVGTLSRGTMVEIHEFDGDWAKISYNGGYAYAHAFYLNITGDNYLLAGHTIVVDPGHGGHDGGASANGLTEKNVVLDVSLLVYDQLLQSGANVVMTRSTDVFVSLAGRVEIAENANADSFVSVHANAAGSEAAHGIETFHWGQHASEESKALAEAIQDRLIYDTEANDRGAKEGNFHVIRENTMPAVLVEIGFLTNPAEANLLRTHAYQSEIANSIYQGIVDFHRTLQ